MREKSDAHMISVMTASGSMVLVTALITLRCNSTVRL